MTYKLFTIEDGRVTVGAKVGALKLKGAGVEIPAIVIGEEGRGRSLGVVPVEGAAPGDTIDAAVIGVTRSGAPKFTAVGLGGASGTECLVVFRTPIGFRGGNNHTGDRVDMDAKPEDLKFHPFPGTPLVQGTIAQGDAGRMGSGQQMVARIPAGVVFRTSYSGRLYGSPSAHYYVFRDGHILAATAVERKLCGLF